MNRFLKAIFLIISTSKLLSMEPPSNSQFLNRAKAAFELSQQKTISVSTLPADLKRKILFNNCKSLPAMNLPSITKEILTFSAINKDCRAAVNNPYCMLTILQFLPKAGALVVAKKLNRMQSIKCELVQNWIKSIKLEKGKKLYRAILNERSRFCEPNLKNA